MSRLRSHWLALFGGGLLLVFSVSSAFGAKPDGDGQSADTNRGQQVSDFVHELIFGDVLDEEEVDEEEVDEEEVDEEEVDEEETDNHGQCVREVAQSDAVGGPNENHGGAVSEAARVTCWEDGSDEEPTDEDPVEDADEGETEASTQESDDEASNGRGKSAAAHERNAARKADRAGRGNGNGHGHGPR